VRRRVEEEIRGLLFKAHRLVYHSTLASRVVKKRRRRKYEGQQRGETPLREGGASAVMYVHTE